ncbi:MAG: MmcQ/YjbR family DNA-binding protein [Cystobacter sp.]
MRALCLALPETSERLSHGSPAFFIRDKKTFVSFLDNHHGDGRLALWCAAPPGMQDDLVRSQPERFFIPPYVGVRGWVGVRLDRGEPWETVASLVREAWRTVAPKTLLARLDAPSKR